MRLTRHIALACLMLAQPVLAQELDCVAIYEDALEKKKSGALTQAHTRFAECTKPSCPGPVREECAGQARRLAQVIPTVVPAAKTSSGRELVEVRVLADGKLLTERLSGRGHRLDPGPHTFRFEAAELPPVEVSVVLAEGERLRRIEAVFDAGTTAAGAQPIPLATWILGGVGVAGLIGFTYFGLSGLSQESDLESQNCEPRCSTDATDDIERTYLFADISLAIGVAALGGATYVYFSSRQAGGEPGAEARTLVGVGGRF